MRLFFLSACLFLTQPANAQPPAMQCGDRSAVLSVLSDRMGQTRRAIGLAGQQAVMELFAADTGRWTITVTLPNGQTCLLANGDAFEGGNLALPAQGRPA